MKLFTIETQIERFGLRPRFKIGDLVTPNASYTGDDDRRGLVATIQGIENYELESGHVALEECGMTHEEVYTVKYSDGETSTLWHEECEPILTGGVK